jgi:hypothetical protein
MRKTSQEQAIREEIVALAHIANAMQADIARILVKLSLLDRALSSLSEGSDLPCSPAGRSERHLLN